MVPGSRKRDLLPIVFPGTAINVYCRVRASFAVASGPGGPIIGTVSDPAFRSVRRRRSRLIR